jgi:glycosyltransferase involved in cell wall biosynthesis
MKIAIDARELAGRRTGVGRYLAELLNEWAASDAATKHEWLLYSHQPLRVPAAFAASVRLHLGSGGTQWEQITLARAVAADRPAVLFAPGYTAPLRVSLPIALTIHDVSFFAHPEWFAFREGMRRRVMTRFSAARARVVITDSGFSRDEIARHVGVARAKIRVVPLGIRRQAAKSKENIREPVVLFVGSIFRRRHVDTLIEAFATRVVPQVPGS